MIATLPIAATTGHAHHLATIVLADLAADTTIADADKAMLRARAEVLRAHAERLSSAIEHFDPQGKANPSITLANLSARAGALNEEHRLAFREWGIWQVRHGLRSAEDIVEVFDIDRAIGN